MALGVKPQKNLMLVRAYMEALVRHFKVTDLAAALQSVHALAAYVMYKTGRDPEGCPPRLQMWNANSAADNVSALPTALRYLGLPAPAKQGVDTQRLRKGIVRFLPEVCTESRPAISLFVLQQAHQLLLDQRTLHGSRAAALLGFMTFTMMRATEHNRVTSRTRVVATRSSMVLYIRDKTHTTVWRQLLFAPRSVEGSTFSTQHAFDTAFRLWQRNALHLMFAETVWREVRGALQRVGQNTMGSLRPTGVLLHMQLGTPVPLMKKIGGWAATSNVWMQHYFDVTKMAE